MGRDRMSNYYTTKVRRQREWSMFKILGSWIINYIGSAFMRLAKTTQ